MFACSQDGGNQVASSDSTDVKGAKSDAKDQKNAKNSGEPQILVISDRFLGSQHKCSNGGYQVKFGFDTNQDKKLKC